MENMDKELTVSKWVLINQPKIPQMLQHLSAQIVCPSPKVWNFDEKRIHWASVVRGLMQCSFLRMQMLRLNAKCNDFCIGLCPSLLA